jgi:hypothetical protein
MKNERISLNKKPWWYSVQVDIKPLTIRKPST